MNAGKLRRRVAVQNVTTSTVGSRGQETGEPVTVARPWVEIVSETGTENDTANRRNVERTIQLRMRYVPLLTEESKIVLRGRTLSVLNVENVGERDREMLVTCAEQR